ncbi:MAG: MBL fold metallo-hydrolase [Gemmatimonadota bacterium]|nr:MAG: MBL fold metallo-hydrolase [Gemmatimonadota bacterium]
MKNFILTLCTFITSFFVLPVISHPDTIVLTGGTLIDVSNFGHSQTDIEKATVVIAGQKIVAVGHKNEIQIPKEAKVIDATGTYILPGLIDGFASLDNQAYANAYLYMGVTSIVGIHGYRRAPLFEDANPCPNIFRFGSIGSFESETSEMLHQIEDLAQDGVRFLILHYGLRPDQLQRAVEKAHSRNMVTVGELGYTSYKEAIQHGVDAFVHSGRYSIELAPPEMQAEVAAEPFGPPARQFRRWLAGIDPEDELILEYAKILGSGSAALMPTLSLSSMDLPILENPWNEPVATILHSQDIHFPLDTTTGKHTFGSSFQNEIVRLGENIIKIEQKYYQAGAKYLAGSGTDISGTMPGISLHQELLLLTQVGLTEREAVAAATSNFPEIFGWKEVGQIKPGCRADILVTNKNPLDNIKNLKAIHSVIVRGELLDREKLLQFKSKNPVDTPQGPAPENPVHSTPAIKQEHQYMIPGLGNPDVRELAENVIAVTDLYHPAGEDAGTNAGMIFTSKSVIFIDAGMSIASAEFLWKTAGERMKGDETLYLILTHRHSDHVFGMRVMKEKGARVIAHQILKEWFGVFKDRYKDVMVHRLGWSLEKADQIFGDVLLSHPDQIITQDTVLQIDGEEIHLLTTPGHLPDELSVYHPKSRTLFAGDAIYEGMNLTTHFGGPAEWKQWIAQLERLRRLNIDMIIPGHGKPCPKEEIDRNISYLKEML